MAFNNDSDKNVEAAGDVKRGSSLEDEQQNGTISHASGSVIDAQEFSYTEDRKIGVTGAVFLILNKMIGTGSESQSWCPAHLTMSGTIC